MKKLLVIRFSAIGDVAMTIPVLYACAQDNPQLRIVVLSREFLRPLFSHMPPNVHFKGVDLKETYRGIGGLNRLYRELKKEKYDAVADFHDVLRSQYLRWRFKMAGIPVAHIRKGRDGKKRLVRPHNKVMEQQKSSFRRYAEVLEELGIRYTSEFKSLFPDKPSHLDSLINITGEKENNRWVGIAPFAAHEGKIYPSRKMELVIQLLLAHRPDIRIFLFGGGEKERPVLERWAKKYSRVTSLAGKLKMDEELRIMNHLNVMLSMDSANMHLASLAGAPVVSIWGTTHPYAGFMGWNQKEEDAIQLDMPCRPCSIYGNKPCRRGNYACLDGISPDTVVERLKRYID